ncbi:MAG: hypothetical protein AUH86_17375 [Acidobacteria bacterium 13_1_40CM_4_58_4]|nr:MAG: hypothetical protein AUH86_17375 [Acidobacteria bacterium 13_1_40CM_4_58_4]
MLKTPSRYLTMTAITIGVLLGVGPSRPIGYSRARQHAAAPATFYREVLPILQQHCQVCHRNGGIAPMPFESYRQTQLFARAISKAAEEKTMPPWFADPSVGHFSNDPSLSAAEIVALVAWTQRDHLQGRRKTPRHGGFGWKAGASRNRT